MPKVSICIPTYNQPETLRECLKSVLIQTFQDYEIILSDDSQSCLIKDLLDEFDFNGKLKYYHHLPSLGSPENWNFCIGKASGKLIKIMHHDDWFKYDYSLLKFVELMDDNPLAVMGFSDSFVLFENGLSYIHSTTSKRFEEININPSILFLNNELGGPSATIFRKEVKTVFDSNLIWLVDVDFYILTLAKYGKLAYIPQPLVTTFEVSGRISNSCIGNAKIQIFEHFYLYNKILQNFSTLRTNINLEYIIYLIKLCLAFKINKISTIRKFGFKGKINLIIRAYIYSQYLHHSPRFTNLYTKILKINQKIVIH